MWRDFSLSPSHRGGPHRHLHRDLQHAGEMKAARQMVDIYGHVSLLRTQKNYMVQTEVRGMVALSVEQSF